MLELPEVLARTAELRKNLVGKTVDKVLPPSKAHKFCWYNGEPESYHAALTGKKVTGAEGFGIFAELLFGEAETGENAGPNRLCINDGVNMRLVSVEKVPKNYQLVITFTDGTALVFTVAMYGGIYLHDGTYDNEYYEKSRQAVSPFAPEFEEFFYRRKKEESGRLSAKAFLATKQRFPGIGNGVLQDILFEARIHPKRKVETLKEEEWNGLYQAVISVLREMTEQGGRDTEKDLFGNPGRYVTKMSKNACAAGCPVCGGAVTKEAYLGGSVYYCSTCQV